VLKPAKMGSNVTSNYLEPTLTLGKPMAEVFKGTKDRFLPCLASLKQPGWGYLGHTLKSPHGVIILNLIKADLPTSCCFASSSSNTHYRLLKQQYYSSLCYGAHVGSKFVRWVGSWRSSGPGEAAWRASSLWPVKFEIPPSSPCPAFSSPTTHYRPLKH